MPEKPPPPPEKKGQPFLRIVSGQRRSSLVPMNNSRLTIGRSEENDVVLPDARISRHHAEIIKRDEGFFISDLGSHNRIRVNGELVQETQLHDRDEIKIGPVTLKFLTGTEDGSALDKDIVFDQTEDFEEGNFKSIQISAEDCSHMDLQSVITASKLSKTLPGVSLPPSPEKRTKAEHPPLSVSSLERMNKVLFVLYEISRQLMSFQDHTELFKKIMDLILMVIDADYGFLILVDQAGDEPYLPMVVKFRDEEARHQGRIRASRTLIKKVVDDRIALLTSNALTDDRFDTAESLVQQHIRSSMCVPLWKSNEIIAVIQLNSVKMKNPFTEDDLELLKSIGCQMSMVLEQVSLNDKIREEEKIKNWLSRFHSPQVIEAILTARAESENNPLEAKDQEVTILFVDIIGFTRMSEKMSPLEVNRFLNAYFSLMTDIVFDNEGTLDKYIGDGVMAVFGAPIGREDDAERAVRSALKMRRDLIPLIKEMTGGKSFQIRIGVNTGHAVAGSVGSPRRMDYTVIGDAVNVASRLESIAQPNQILIGEETYRRVGEKFITREIGRRSLKGRSSDVLVYEVLDDQQEDRHQGTRHSQD